MLRCHRLSRPFGSCCPDFQEGLHEVPSSQFRVEANGVLYLTIRAVASPEGTGWMDHAVLFCPVCGIQLQEREAIAATSQNGGVQ
jgi:hypothetical protein